MNVLYRIIGIISGVCIFLAILSFSVSLPTYNKNFYYYEYGVNQTYTTINVTKSDMAKVTDVLIGYMQDKYKTLDVQVPVAGTVREFFNEKEKEHMVDVKNMLMNGTKIMNVSLILFALCFIAFIKFKEKRRLIAYYSRCGLVVLLVGSFCLIALIASDFDKYFTMFHQIFFTNSLWVLDPRVDLLINIVPLHFFSSISAVVGCLMALLCGLYILVVSIVLKKYLTK